MPTSACAGSRRRMSPLRARRSCPAGRRRPAFRAVHPDRRCRPSSTAVVTGHILGASRSFGAWQRGTNGQTGQELRRSCPIPSVTARAFMNPLSMALGPPRAAGLARPGRAAFALRPNSLPQAGPAAVHGCEGYGERLSGRRCDGLPSTTDVPASPAVPRRRHDLRQRAPVPPRRPRVRRCRSAPSRPSRSASSNAISPVLSGPRCRTFPRDNGTLSGFCVLFRTVVDMPSSSSCCICTLRETGSTRNASRERRRLPATLTIFVPAPRRVPDAPRSARAPA